MPVPFHCSQCGFQTKVKDELAGKKIKCPKCKAPGAIGGGAAAGPQGGRAKKARQDDPEQNLLNLNLDAYQDVEVPEGEILDEREKPEAKKAKKSKKKSSLDPQVKVAAIGFSLLSVLVLAGLVYFGGQELKEEWDNYSARSDDSESPISGIGGEEAN